MTTYVETWDETKPAGTRARSLGDDDIREFKRAVRERLSTDHIAVADETGYSTIGHHKKITFSEIQTVDPTNLANTGFIYMKDVTSKAELFWEDEDGNVIQLTDQGVINFVVSDVTEKTTAIDEDDYLLIQDSEDSDNNKRAKASLLVPTGSINLYGGSSAPTGWLLCRGQAVSRVLYPDLFSVIGTTYGSGDGTTTFNVPNIMGNVPVGLSTSDADFDTLGETGGAKTHVHAGGDLKTQAITSFVARGAAAPTFSSGGANAIDDQSGGTDRDGYNADNVTVDGNTASASGLPPFVVLNYIIKC